MFKLLHLLHIIGKCDSSLCKLVHGVPNSSSCRNAWLLLLWHLGKSRIEPFPSAATVVWSWDFTG